MKYLKSFLLAIALPLCICRAQDHSYVLQPQDAAVRDTTLVLCIGNSFTFYFDTYNMLAEIACSQGHFIKAKATCYGGYSFACHLAEPRTHKGYEAREDGNEIIFLQNHSQLNAYVGRDPRRYKFALDDAKELAGRIKAFVPNGRCIFESTWSYPKYNYGSFGSLEAFDAAMLKGTKLMAKRSKAEVSPIGNAFTICRRRHPEINLLYSDGHHQSKEGAYLKSCVNYLVIFGGEFVPQTSCCGLDRDVALKLQSDALEAVRSFR